jgi:hypothetical protein
MSVDKFGRMSHRILRRYDNDGKDIEFTDGEVDFKNRKISRILAPTADNDAANKAYVDKFIYNMYDYTDKIQVQVNELKVTSASLTHVRQSLLEERDEIRQLSADTTDRKFIREKAELSAILQEAKEKNLRSDPPDPIQLGIIKLLQEIVQKWIRQD